MSKTFIICILCAKCLILADSKTENIAKLIHESKAMDCVSWDLTMDGDEIFEFKNNLDHIIYAVKKTSGPKGKFKFIEIRILLHPKSESFITKRSHSKSYEDFRRMVNIPGSNKINDVRKASSFRYLVKLLNEQ